MFGKCQRLPGSSLEALRTPATWSLSGESAADKQTIPAACDWIVTAIVTSYCMIFSDIADRWGVQANNPALLSLQAIVLQWIIINGGGGTIEVWFS